MKNTGIKFKVYDLLNKKELSSYADKGLLFYQEGKFVGVDWYITASELENPQRYSVHRFTGMQDKNGKGVFDGDILSRKNADDLKEFKVEIDTVHGVRLLDENGEKYNYIIELISFYFEIIGNTHNIS